MELRKATKGMVIFGIIYAASVALYILGLIIGTVIGVGFGGIGSDASDSTIAIAGGSAIGMMLLLVVSSIAMLVGVIGSFICGIFQIIKYEESSQSTLVLISGILGVMGGGFVSLILSAMVLKNE